MPIKKNTKPKQKPALKLGRPKPRKTIVIKMDETEFARLLGTTNFELMKIVRAETARLEREIKWLFVHYFGQQTQSDQNQKNQTN